MPKKAQKVGDWTVHVTHGLMLRSGSRRLAIGLTHIMADEWQVMAIETSAKAANANAVLDDHAHHLVGIFPFALAIEKAELYAVDWSKKKRTSKKCPCPPIGKTKR